MVEVVLYRLDAVFGPEEPFSFSKTEVPVFCTPRDSMVRVGGECLIPHLFCIFIYVFCISKVLHFLWSCFHYHSLSLFFSLSDFEDTFSKWMRLIQKLFYANSLFLNEGNFHITFSRKSSHHFRWCKTLSQTEISRPNALSFVSCKTESWRRGDPAGERRSLPQTRCPLATPGQKSCQ